MSTTTDTFDRFRACAVEILDVEADQVVPEARFADDLDADSLDLVELNPFLDERGRTATLLVDLTASLMGRRIMDRPTRSY